MSKKFLKSFIIYGTLVACAILWILSAAGTIDWFNPSAAVAIFAGVTGVVFILSGLFGQTKALPLKKLSIYFGAGLLVVALFSAINAFDVFRIENKLILPIIATIAAGALFLGMLAVGGKKWDGGDNQNVGYKNYYERKAEEDKERGKKD
ncbi:MAG: hypothetical protein LBP26_00775 [Clostridiales bacterium]|jgi:hypothetical protein|nr:hypothetical protein [Clostridiales bacterium]